MAVVQISKIQLRRGQKNQGTGMPQLDTAEMGWAIDTEELFIGNKVSEGAPETTNIRILTERDNLLENFTNAYYQYRSQSDIQTGSTAESPILRSVNDRLDDQVSVKAFGATGDGSTDDTISIQRAIDQLYLLHISDKSYKATLTFEPGTYLVSASIYIPSFVTIAGSGVDKTIIYQVSDCSTFITVNDSSSIGVYNTTVDVSNLNQPRNILIRDITITAPNSDSPMIESYCTRDSKFSNVKFIGRWEIGQTTADTAVKFISHGLIINSNISFVGCEFKQFNTVMSSNWDIEYIMIDNCKISLCANGISFGDTIDGISPGKTYGASKCKFANNYFESIAGIGINILYGSGNISQSNTFVSVGANNQFNNLASLPSINFDMAGNISDNDYFDRSVELSASRIDTDPYKNEISGYYISNHKYNAVISNLPIGTTPSIVLKLAADSVAYNVHYFYSSAEADVKRKGTLSLTIDNVAHTVILVDDFDINGNSSNFGNLVFSADYNTGNSAINIMTTNTTNPDTGYIHFWYESLA